MNLKNHYQKEIVPNLKEKLGYKSVMEVPKLEKITINTTPETYSGVAVVMIEKVDRDLSVRVPSRIPAITPTKSAEGTITSITQNMSFPVSANLLPIISSTFP